jgi:LPS sulfotransferase NodH
LNGVANAEGFRVPTYLFMASEVRCGSTYVAELISYSLNASLGFEVWDLAKELLRNVDDSCSPLDIRTEVSALWLSPHNIRSSKLMCPQLSIMTRCARVDRSLEELVFGKDARWIIVRRRNKIRQAVSLAVARKSGVYHSYEHDKAQGSGEASAADVEDALRAVILSDEYLRLFSSVPAVAAQVFYEDVCRDPMGVISGALRKIGFMPEDKCLAPVEPKLVPDHQAEKAHLETTFSEWLLENHHPTLGQAPESYGVAKQVVPLR